jgi:hypothetical protein
VWVVVIVVGTVGALVAAWWVDREGDPLARPPERGADYCNAVAEMQGDGDITTTLAQGAPGLQRISDGFGRLQEAGVPSVIEDDLEALRLSLDPVIRAALEVELTDPAAIAELSGRLDEQVRPLQSESDRVNEYTARWCGVDLNGVREPDEVPAAPVESVPAEAQPPSTPPPS